MATVTAAYLAAPAATRAAALAAVAQGLTGPAHEHCLRAARQPARALRHLAGTDATVAQGALSELVRTLDDIRGIAAAYGRIAGDPITSRTLPGDRLPLGQEMVAAIARRADHATCVVDYLAALHADRARAITSAGAERYEGGYEPRPASVPVPAQPAADPLPGAVAIVAAIFAVLVVVLLLTRCSADPTAHALTVAVQTWSNR